MSNTTDKPWENEPDHLMFMSEAGYVCEIRRQPSFKHLCGYVYIPMGHPDYGKGYNDLYTHDCVAAPDVHGGWTYSQDGGDEDGGRFTKFGFDCGHAGDLSPGMSDTFKGSGWGFFPGDAVVYRDIAYVTAELERAAMQFKQRKEKV